jgi:hypothetical protein
MFFKGTSVRRMYQYFLVAFMSLSSFALLYTFRSVDDNRLTSWNWVFSYIDVKPVFLYLSLGILIAYLLSRASFPERRPVLFLLVSSGAASMVFWSEPELIVDASRYITQAKHLETYGIVYFFKEWGRDIPVWTDLPLVPFLYGLLFTLAGESRIVIQVFTTVLFSLTVVCTHLIGKTLWNRYTGFFGGILLLGIPYIYSQVPLFLVDVPAMFILTFSIYAFIMAIEKGRSWITLSAVAVFLTFFSKYSAWLMLSVFGAVFLVYLKHPPNSRRTVLQRSIAVSYVSFILILVLFVLKFDVFSGQIAFLHEYQMPGLRRWGEGFVSTFFYQTHPFITAAALFSMLLAIKERDVKYLIISWMSILIVLLQIRRARYILITLPMFVLMASYGMQRIKTLELRRFVIYSVMVSSLVIGVFAYLPFLQKMGPVNLKHAGRFLNNVEEHVVEVITLPTEGTIVNPAVAVPILDFFTDKDISYRYTDDNKPSFEKIKKSPLRFTWTYKNPGYYQIERGTEEGKAVVIISNGVNPSLPDSIGNTIKDYDNTAVFDSSTGIFRYSPVVSIYQRRQKS